VAGLRACGITFLRQTKVAVSKGVPDGVAAPRNVEGIAPLYQLLVESVRDYAIFALDATGHVLTWNRGAERMKGYRADEIIGRHFSAFYPPADIASRKPWWELEVAEREGRFEDEGWRLRKDGSPFWANVVITALRNPDGTLRGFAKVTRDLTERRAAELRAMADTRRVAEAEAANRTKSEFLRSMSHELRTPINATLGYAELMQAGIAGAVTEQQKEFLARLCASQRHLLQIITDMLDYSRIEAGHMEYNIVSVDPHQIVDAVMPMVEPQAASAELTIRHVRCAHAVTGRADLRKAEQVVLNLLSNAVKFTPAGGSITVRCDASDSAVSITVADTGPGIKPDEQGAIFEPFVQVGRSLTSTHQGTGLGLAISRDLARAMGGDLLVSSVPGEGASFTLLLPRDPSDTDAR
jgi:PAS domain S-box-containing protein